MLDQFQPKRANDNRLQPLLTVTAAVIVRDGKVLIARRDPGLTNGGRWEFPGGKVKTSEDPRSCLQRELKEELGIASEVLDKIGTVTHEEGGGRLKLLFFRTKWLDGKMCLRDHTEIRWVEPVRLVEFDLTPADRQFAAGLQIPAG
jgi:8-oxo-dGTP diphosphatase